MLFVSHPEIYNKPQIGLNELCLLNSLQRQYVNKQQQREKKVIQKMNQPNITLTQDSENYFIVLNKNITNNNYNYINKFNGYSIKQISNHKLLIRSPRDNFYKIFNLPKNIDLNNDIVYKLFNDGFKLVISIPKIRNSDINDFAKFFEKLGNTDDVFGSCFNNGMMNLHGIDRPAAAVNRKAPAVCQKVRIPIDTSPEDTDNSGNDKEEEEEEENASMDDEAMESEIDEEEEPASKFGNVVKVAIDESVEEQDEPKVNMLKNYETIKRNTTFLENVSNDEAETVPVKRLYTPVLEDVVDAEFL